MQGLRSDGCGPTILYVGPSPSHISALIEEHGIGWHKQHGDVAGTVDAMRTALDLSQSDLEAMGERAQRAVNSLYSKDQLRSRLIDAIEKLL